MSRKKKNYVGKIGYCDNINLNGLQHLSGGHYVYIRKLNNDGTCDVNIITSLEDNHGNYDYHKLKQVKKGNTYAVPKYDANFARWSGVNKKPIQNVKISDINYLNKKKIKKRHHFFIGKYMK